jgi:nucleoside 2-deoxyribosyltransferase
MKNKTTKPKVYLAGRMGEDPRDRQWRLDITPFLIKLGFKVMNPYLLEIIQLRGLRPGRLPEKTPDGSKVTHWFDLFKFPQDTPEYRRAQKYMRAIIDYDLGLVEKADLIVARWSEGCKTGAGTHSELTYARKLRKMTYLVNEAKNIPEWTQGCVNRIFSSMEELQKYLMEEYDNKDVDTSQELIN